MYLRAESTFESIDTNSWILILISPIRKLHEVVHSNAAHYGRWGIDRCRDEMCHLEAPQTLQPSLAAP